MHITSFRTETLEKSWSKSRGYLSPATPQPRLYKRRSRASASIITAPGSKIYRMTYKMGWKGTAAFQVFSPHDRELVFDLPEGLGVPDVFEEGDELDVILCPADPASIQLGNNYGYYKIVHSKSGLKFQVPHAASEWRFDKLCKPCNLRIFKTTDSYGYKKPDLGVVVPTRLTQFHVLKDAFHAAVCPLCGNHMEQDIA